MNTTRCPCGSPLNYEDCCAPYHHGAAAPTAASLMRSRYSAYVLKLADYLRDSWHASTRPATLAFAGDDPQWCGLEIRQTRGGSADDQHGEVEFIAHWLAADGKTGALHERSRFVREEGRWYYVDGELFPVTVRKPGRNDPCPCGSGRKYKQCCGR